MSDRLYVLVGGWPGSGKSTLAAMLAAELGLALLAKDAVKEALMDALGAPATVAESQRLGRAAVHAVLRTAITCPGAVIDSTWYPYTLDLVRALPGRRVEVRCVVPVEVARSRYAARVRDPRHLDTERTDSELWGSPVPPLGVGPLVEVDTSTPIDVAAVAARIRGTDGPDGTDGGASTRSDPPPSTSAEPRAELDTQRMLPTRLAALGRVCFAHPVVVLGAWLVFLAAGVLSIGPVFAGLDTGGYGSTPTESQHAYDVLDASSDQGTRYVVLVDRVDATSAEVLTAVTAATTDLRSLDGVAQVLPAQPAPDGRALVVQVTLRKSVSDDDDQKAAAEARIDKRVAELRTQLPRADIAIGGQSLINAQANGAVQQDLGHADRLSLPLTLVVLLVVFGGLIVAAVPVLAAVATAIGSFAVLWVFSRFVAIDSNAVSVVSILALALAIDYGLLIVSRYRQELAAGAERGDAIARTWATAGHTVLFSGAVVAGSLSGLMLFAVPQLQTIGAAGVSAVLIGIVTALTFTAAVLRVLGRRVRPARASARSGRLFERIGGVTQRRPAVVATGAVLVLLALGAPVLGLRLTLPGLSALPPDLPAVQVATTLSERFGQSSDPDVTVVARLDPAELQGWAAGYAGRGVTVGTAVAVGSGVSLVDFDVPGDSEGEAARALVDRLRADRPADGASWVTGPAAQIIDFQTLILDRLPLAVLVVAGVMIVLLAALTGSLVLPLKALLMNVLSLSATFGALVAIFQNGWLSGLLGTTTIGGLDPFVLVLVTAFAFGLSMDYELFLLSRIKERYDAGEPNNVAVRHGLRDTGRIITSAALLMMILFGFFGAARMSDLQQVGIGLFVAVLVDATLVRCLLVPATMTLLGRWNWWAPWHRRPTAVPSPADDPPPHETSGNFLPVSGRN